MTILRIVLTGGPCGGKTTALNHLRDSLPKLGITPIFVPELATMIFQCGIRWKDFEHNPTSAFRFQANMIKSQIANEELIFNFAHLVPGVNKVMICDRGTVDNMVYAKDEWHEDILSQVGSLGILKLRYDSIIHLNSLAWGDDYRLDNPARWETKEGAQLTDQRTWELWERGPAIEHIRIPHSDSLEDKLGRVTTTIVSRVTELTAPLKNHGNASISPSI